VGHCPPGALAEDDMQNSLRIGIVLLILLGLIILLILGQALYRSRSLLTKEDWKANAFVKDHQSFFDYGLYLSEAMSGRDIDDFVPMDYPSGKIFYIDITKDKRFGDMSPGTKVYAVRIDPSSSPLQINGKTWDHVVGILACDGLDGKIDYSEEHNSLVQCRDDISGATLGDPAVLFQDLGMRGIMDSH